MKETLLDKKTKLYVLEYLYKVRAQNIDPEGLDRLEIPELAFAVSPHDLLHNVIEVKRARRAFELSIMDRSNDRDLGLSFVSEGFQ